MSKTVCLVSPPTWDSRVLCVSAQVGFFTFSALSGLLGDILVTCSEGPRGNIPKILVFRRSGILLVHFMDTINHYNSALCLVLSVRNLRDMSVILSQQAHKTLGHALFSISILAAFYCFFLCLFLLWPTRFLKRFFPF